VPYWAYIACSEGSRSACIQALSLYEKAAGIQSTDAWLEGHTWNQGWRDRCFVVQGIQGIAKRPFLQLNTPVQLICFWMQEKGFLELKHARKRYCCFASEFCHLQESTQESSDAQKCGLNTSPQCKKKSLLFPGISEFRFLWQNGRSVQTQTFQD